MCDFTKHKHPVLAVACPTCKAKVGVWCKRPSGHKASDLHKSRNLEADLKFVEKHGMAASIEKTDSGWKINPTGYKR